MTFLTLQNPMRYSFLFHSIFGIIALLIFLVPFFSKKGGKLHVRTGWIYTYAMVLVCTSAFIITPWRVFLDENRSTQSQGFSTFLFFIAYFTLASLYFGIVVLKQKQRELPSRALIHIGPPIFLILLGVVVQLIGLAIHSTLLIIFPILAYLTAKSHLTYWMTKPISKRHWWYAHMSGMGAACIATVTAFLVTAVPKLWENSAINSPLVWIVPGLIGGFLLKRETKKYQAQFGDL